MRLKWFCFPILLMVSACSMLQQTHPFQVEVDQGVFVTLPTPQQLRKTLNVSQLITAQWGNKEQKLQVQLQVDKESVVLAGFSAWGAPILSLTYSGEEIQTYLLSGLVDSLPKPEQVLFNLMISIWPVDAWQKPLAQIGWRLEETGLQRELIDDKGHVVATVTYQTKPYIDGVIVFKHHSLDYTITIETNRSDADRE